MRLVRIALLIALTGLGLMTTLSAQVPSPAGRMLFLTTAQLKNAHLLFVQQQSTNDANGIAPSAAALVEALNDFGYGRRSIKKACKDASGHYVLANSTGDPVEIPSHTFQYGCSPETWGARNVACAIELFSFGAMVDPNDGQKWADCAWKWSRAASEYPLWGQSLCGANNPPDWGECVAQRGLVGGCRINGKNVRVFEFSDLASGQLLFSLSLAYSWLPRLTASLSPQQIETLQLMRKALAVHGQQAFCHANTPGGQPHDQPFNNHFWVCNTGLAAAGYALLNDPIYKEDAKIWIRLAKSNYSNVFSHLWTDGAWHEGPMYGDYAVSWAFRFHDLVYSQENNRFLSQFPNAQKWFANYANYRLATTLPFFLGKGGSTIFPEFPISVTERSVHGPNAGFAPAHVIDLADSFRQFDIHPTAVLRRLAADQNNAALQDLASRLPQGKNASDYCYWLDFAWYNPIPNPGLRILPEATFDDLGLTFDRSTSEIADDVSVLTFVAGPPLSRLWVGKSCAVDPGVGHAHAAAGSFSLSFSSSSALAGAYLIAHPGYSAKLSQLENTLTLDVTSETANGPTTEKLGQYGESRAWLRWADPKHETPACMARPTLRPVSGEQRNANSRVQVRSADLTGAYPTGLGVGQYLRTLVFFKQLNALLVFDLIKPASNPRPPANAKFALRFHSDYLPVQQADGGFIWSERLSNQLLKGSQSQTLTLQIRYLALDATTAVGATVRAIDETYPPCPTVPASTVHAPVVLVTRPASMGEWKSIIAITWGTTDPLDAQVVRSLNNDRFVVRVGKADFTFKLQANGGIEVLEQP